MKQYLKRSLRYMLRLVILLAIVFLLLSVTGTLNVDKGELLKALFLSSRGIILIGALVVLAAVYPKWAFATTEIRGDMDGERDAIVNAFASYGYSLARDEGNVLIFRADGLSKKLLSQWDDAVTVEAEDGKIKLEGLKKHIYRIELRIKSFMEG